MVKAEPGFMARSLDSKIQPLPTETPRLNAYSQEALAARVYRYVSSSPPIAAISFCAGVKMQQGHTASMEGNGDF